MVYICRVLPDDQETTEDKDQLDDQESKDSREQLVPKVHVEHL